MLCSAMLLAAWACGFPSYTAPGASTGASAGTTAGANTGGTLAIAGVSPVGTAGTAGAGTAGTAGASTAGASGTAGAGTAGTAGCVAGGCEEPCPAGFLDCNQDLQNDCETPLGSDSNCGGCGIACSNEHGLNHCGTSGQCEPTCAVGYGDCDLRPETGCETSIYQDSLNCGSCGVACPSNGGTPLCVAGKCGVSSCNTGFGDCTNAGACSFNLNTDPQNCGRCGHVCSSSHGTPRCNGGVCESECAAGYGDCNHGGADTSPPNDGCETQLNVPDAKGGVLNCGACGSRCDRRPFTVVNLKMCAAGTCFLDCMAGATDCGNDRNDPSCSGVHCGCDFVACK